MLLAALLLAAAAPSPEALALGRQVADGGMLAQLLPVMVAKETDDLVAAHPELPEDDRRRLRETAAAVGAAGRERLLAAVGRAYAEQVPVADLRVVVAFLATPAAARWRGAEPQVMAATMAAVGSMDFKKDVRAAFCRDTGKLCAEK